ncbi:hypothetical protein NQ317_001265 [Molorchus minor]|uniref:Uncharacterized protein n=1 Tax=Molorchus minor TaxID=1323400 RepID=A0ABQ9IVW8_9CUCU|nr:hypothetical protein NQ317_001265 [Molorchus minor]
MPSSKKELLAKLRWRLPLTLSSVITLSVLINKLANNSICCDVILQNSNLDCTKLNMDATEPLCYSTYAKCLFEPLWLVASPETIAFGNETLTYKPSVGVYAKCSRPAGFNHPVCTLLSVAGLGSGNLCISDSVEGRLCIYRLRYMLHYWSNAPPDGLGQRKGAEIVRKGCITLLHGRLLHRVGLWVAVTATLLTFLCACLSVPAEKSTSSDKVQDKIYEGQTLICLT